MVFFIQLVVSQNHVFNVYAEIEREKNWKKIGNVFV